LPWPWYGFAFGCILFVFAFGSAGAGHGTYLPFAIFAAPVSLIPRVGLFSAPVWWAAVGWTLKHQQIWLSASSMIIHTAAVGLVLSLGTPGNLFGERWWYFRRTERAMPLWLWSGIVVYLMGVVLVWWVILRAATSQKQVKLERPAD
jgi:hypothetical protein